MNERRQGDSKFWIGFFIGGLLGAITLFFLGTREGKKAGKALEERGRDFLDDLLDRIGELEEKGRELIREGDEIKENVIGEIEDKKEELTVAATEKIDSALAHIEALQEHGRQTTANLRKRLFRNIPKK